MPNNETFMNILHVRFEEGGPWIDIPALRGEHGDDGISPGITVSDITGGHRITITDRDHPDGQNIDVMDGESGTDGEDGEDGVSPGVTITEITGGHQVKITDKDHPSGQMFNVMDGEDGASDAGEVTYDPTETYDEGTIGAAANALNAGKVDKVTGKGLSTEDYTTAEKSKLAGIAAGAEANVQSDWDQTDSTADDYIKNKPEIPEVPTALSELTDDSTHRLVTDTEKAAWNGKGTYSKPAGGIPKTDLVSGVQDSLDLADTALQEHQSLEGYATEEWVDDQGFLTEHQSLAAYRTSAAQDVIDAGKISAAAQAEKTADMTQPVGIDEDGKLWGMPGGGGGSTAEDIAYDPDIDYTDGTVGAELKMQTDAITEIDSMLPTDHIYTSEKTSKMLYSVGYIWKNIDGVASVQSSVQANNLAVNAIHISNFYKIDLNLLRAPILEKPNIVAIITDKDYNVLKEFSASDGEVVSFAGVLLPPTSEYLLINLYNIDQSIARNGYYIGYQYDYVLGDKRYLENAVNFESALRSHSSFYSLTDKWAYEKYSIQNGNVLKIQSSGNDKGIVLDVFAGEKYWYSGEIKGFNPSAEPRIIFSDYNNVVISAIFLTSTDNAIHEFEIPFGAERAYINLFDTDSNIKNRYFIRHSCFPLHGLNVAVLGDSISTNGNTGIDPNVPEITITEDDVGIELSAYVTYYDIQAGLSLGGITFTSSDIGTEVTFTPTEDDVGKSIGVPNNKNDNTLKVWWEHLKDHFMCNIIPVCWSGSSISSHESNMQALKTAHAWHDAQIRKCGIRVPGTMTRKAPDYIIIFRGCNDMTHLPYAVLTEDYFDSADYEYPETDDTIVVSEETKYGFKEGYSLTIKKLRETYPNAKIILCTLAEFKRINYSHFPTNNGLYSLPKFNNSIREIAEYFGCGVIELDKCGMTFENISNYAGDNVHPNDRGHALMGAKAIDDLKKLIV